MSIFDNDEAFSEYCKEINQAYWAEEEEMKASIHPSQVKERIEERFRKLGFHHQNITFLDWNIDGPKVKVSTNGSYFGVFNYESNMFEEISGINAGCKIAKNGIYGHMGQPQQAATGCEAMYLDID